MHRIILVTLFFLAACGSPHAVPCPEPADAAPPEADSAPPPPDAPPLALDAAPFGVRVCCSRLPPGTCHVTCEAPRVAVRLEAERTGNVYEGCALLDCESP